MNFLIRGVLLTVLLGLFTPGVLGAQRLRDVPTSAECGEWTSQLSAGGSAALQALNYGFLAGCPLDGPAALAAAIRAARPSQDTAYLGRLVTVAADVQHEVVFRAALEVAGDKTASNESRVMALLVTVEELGSSSEVPGYVRSQLFTQTLPGSGVCGFAISGAGYGIEEPLPGDADRLAARTIDAIQYGTGEPALLKNLSRCARTAVALEIPPQVDTTKLSLMYNCENWYTIRNSTGIRLMVTITTSGANGGSETDDVNISGTLLTRYVAPFAGTVEMRYDGQLLATRENGGTVCQPWTE